MLYLDISDSLIRMLSPSNFLVLTSPCHSDLSFLHFLWIFPKPPSLKQSLILQACSATVLYVAWFKILTPSQKLSPSLLSSHSTVACKLLESKDLHFTSVVSRALNKALKILFIIEWSRNSCPYPALRLSWKFFHFVIPGFLPLQNGWGIEEERDWIRITLKSLSFKGLPLAWCELWVLI